MSLKVSVLEDGTLHYVSKGHVVLTGAIQGNVQTADGTIYNVTPAVVEVADGHAAEVAHLIGTHYVLNGHPTDRTFIYTPPSDGVSGIVMALASAAAENAALNGLDGTGSTNTMGFLSLHVATPGTTGASENANSGSYARQAATWNAASGGTKTNSSSFTFSTLGTVAVTHVGTWSSATYGAGTYSIGAALGSSVTAASITIAAAGISLSAT